MNRAAQGANAFRPTPPALLASPASPPGQPRQRERPADGGAQPWRYLVLDRQQLHRLIVVDHVGRAVADLRAAGDGVAVARRVEAVDEDGGAARGHHLHRHVLGAGRRAADRVRRRPAVDDDVGRARDDRPGGRREHLAYGLAQRQDGARADPREQARDEPRGQAATHRHRRDRRDQRDAQHRADDEARQRARVADRIAQTGRLSHR
jgi:hypothetical protein